MGAPLLTLPALPLILLRKGNKIKGKAGNVTISSSHSFV
jgi:hypothetical protein